MTTSKPTLYVAVGPTGCGKTTVFQKLKSTNSDLHFFSWDEFRLAWYDPDNYPNAWELANQDKQFINKTYDIYHKLIKSKQDVFIDHSSLTVRRRKTWVTPAKKMGYKIVCITFDIPLETLLYRNKTRKDKYVAEVAVYNQSKCLQAPTIGEGFDVMVKHDEIV